MPLNRLNSLVSNWVKNKTRRRRHSGRHSGGMEKWWKTVLDTVFGLMKLAYCPSEHFEQGVGIKIMSNVYSHTLSEYRKTHERVLLIFKRKNAVLESKEIRDVKSRRQRKRTSRWDLRRKGWLWYCVICEKTKMGRSRKRSILRELITKIKSTRKGESTTSNDDGTR